MSKCRPDCCSSSSGEGSGVAIIGFIILAATVYGIIRTAMHAVEAIVHIVIEIVEITAITAGSIAAVALLAFIIVRVVRYHCRKTHRAGLKVRAIALDPRSALIGPMIALKNDIEASWPMDVDAVDYKDPERLWL